MQIDFSAAFDRVNHLSILYKLCSVGIGGSVLSILTQFLSTDHSKLFLMVVEVNWLTLYQECRRAVFWAHCSSSCTLRSFFPFLEIKLIGYADDSTLMAVVPSPGVSVE